MLLPGKLCKLWIQRYYYYITVIIAGLQSISCGCALAWPSPTVLKIINELTPIQDSYRDITGIGYMFFIGGVPGLIVSWVFLTYIGRKSGLLIASLLYAASWNILVFADTMDWVYFARFIQGTAQGLTLTLSSVYIIEISPVSFREVAGFSLQFFFNLGLLLQYSIGPYVSYSSLLYVNLFIALISFILFLMIGNETPYFYLMKKRKIKGEQSLRSFRSHVDPPNEEGIREELDSIEIMLAESNKCSLLMKIKSLVMDKGNRRALIITLGLTYLYVFSGLTQLLMFTETLFRKAKVKISPSLSCICIGVVKLIGGFALPFLVKPFGIKKMVVYSTLVCSFAMFLLGLMYFLKIFGYGLDGYLQWTPLVLLLIYFLFTATGLSYISMHVRAEIFPPDLKSTGILIQEIVNIICLEICSLFFTQLLENMVYIPLWFFSVSMIISVVFMSIYLPDSRTMTLSDIQKWLNK